MSLPLLQERGGALSGLLTGVGQGLQAAMSSIQEMILNKQKQKQQQALLKSILGPQGGERQLSQSQFDQQLGFPEQQAEGLDITPEKIMALEAAGEHNMANSLARLYQGQEKERMHKKRQAEETKVGQDAFNRMAELLRKGNLGLGSELKGKALGGETAEDVGEFASLSGALESMLVDRVSRGTLSNARFKYITETLLPKPTDRQATIKGKMKALARELNLSPDVLLKGKEKSSMKASEGYVLMEDPEGNIKQIPKNKAIEAQRAGGKLVK